MSDTMDKPITMCEYQRKEKELFELLRELSKEAISSAELEEKIDSLCAVYRGGFRHMYSRFYSLVNSLNHTEREILSSNLSGIFEKTQEYIRSGKTENNDEYNCIAKLFDHMNIEFSRVDEATRHIVAEKALEKSIIDKESKVEEINDSIKRISDKYEKSMTDIISVLGIFSAIVMVFFGGFSYVSNAITALAVVSLVKASIICLIAGIVIINTIVAMIYMLAKITGRNILSICTKTSFRSCEGCTVKCGLLHRIKRKMPYVFFINAFITVLLIVLSIYYKFDSISALFVKFNI